MQWVDIFIKLWCFVYNGWKYLLNSDVLYAMGGKIDWTLMFYVQWVERLIEIWCLYACGGKIDWTLMFYMHGAERLIELWCFICTGLIELWCFICMGWKDWLNFDVLYAWGGKIYWTFMFYMHGVERLIELWCFICKRLIELWCFICMGWKDWLNIDVLYAWGGKIDWTLMFYKHGVERLIELWCFICKGMIELWCFICKGWKD